MIVGPRAPRGDGESRVRMSGRMKEELIGKYVVVPVTVPANAAEAITTIAANMCRGERRKVVRLAQEAGRKGEVVPLRKPEG